MKWGELKHTEVAEMSGRVVILPLGSLEQHGHHLPLLTDAMIAGEIARRAEASLGDEALFLPVLWAGASDHHLGFPGTVSVGNDIYVRLLVSILESLIASGSRRIFLLNAHGGNMNPARMALSEIALRHKDRADLYVAVSNWWVLAAKRLAELPDRVQNTVLHACELETSMLMHLQPRLVDGEAMQASAAFFESRFYSPNPQRPNRVEVSQAFDQLSISGAVGRPETATADKGEALFELAAAEVVAFVREFGKWPAASAT